MFLALNKFNLKVSTNLLCQKVRVILQLEVEQSKISLLLQKIYIAHGKRRNMQI